MKLHMNTVEGKAGLIFKKPAWYMSYRLELDDDERRLLEAHPEIGKMTVATGTFGASSSLEIDVNVNMALKGSERSEFGTIARQTAFEQSLREGCAALKSHLERMRQATSGPTTVEF